MAITQPQSNISSTAGSATPACSFASLPGAGSCIVVGWASWKLTAHTHNSMADNQGGTYTQISSTVAYTSGTGGEIRVSLWKRDNIGTPSGTFTVTATASASCDSRLVVAEFAGMATSTLDQSTTGSATNTTATATPSATTNAVDAIVGVVTLDAGGTVTLTENATNLPTLIREDQDNAANQCINVAWRSVSSTGTYTGSWAVTSGHWGCVVAALQGASAATTPFPPFPRRIVTLRR